MFADYLESDDWNRVSINTGRSNPELSASPDIRMRYIPVGPVAVFGPANFPLAFNVAGGDTASVLAAGCPVIVKAHPSHPGVSELVGAAVRTAVIACRLPGGVFSLLFGSGPEVGTRLVQHPAIAAVGFTGSQTVGRRLFDLAAARPEPIPVFAEMSSLNPVILLPHRLAEATQPIAEELCASLTLGVGQFCTKPGIIFIPDDPTGRTFAGALSEKLSAQSAAAMLNRETCRNYTENVDSVKEISGVETLVVPALDNSGGCHAVPALFRISARDFLTTPRLREEVFDPAAVLVGYDDQTWIKSAIDALGGQLTISFYGTEQDIIDYGNIIGYLETRAGRIVCNDVPTGVEVCASMVHGGPWPATSDPRFTSVGTRAVDRFLRPVCYQNFPGHALPPELRG